MYASLSPSRKQSGASGIIALLAILACTAGTIPCAAGQTSAPANDRTYSIHHVYKADDVNRYQITITKRINGARTNGKDYDIKMVLEMKETVKSAGESDQVSVVDEFSNAEGTFDGLDGHILDMMPKLTVNRNRAGQIDVTTDGGQEPMAEQIASLAKAIMQIQDAILPKVPVKIGDTWASEVAKLSPDDDTTTKVTVKFEAVEIVDGVKTLKLKTTTETTGQGKDHTLVHGEGAFNVDTVTGKLIKMTSTTSGTEKASKISSTMLYEKLSNLDTKPASKDSAPQ